jgi:hypothetical protein
MHQRLPCNDPLISKDCKVFFLPLMIFSLLFMRCGYNVTGIILLPSPSCDIRLDHVEIVSEYVFTCAGCYFNTDISCVTSVAEIRCVCSYLSL